MTDFKLDFRVDKLNLGFTGDQFEDWRDRLECYLKARTTRTLPPFRDPRLHSVKLGTARKS
jgi:hypothetical protein